MVDENEVQQPEPGTTPAPEPTLPLFDNDKPPIGPVDVDLADGGEVAPVDAEAPPAPEKPRVQPRGNRQPAGERINDMRFKLGEEQRARQAEAARAEAAEARAAALEQQNRELAVRSQHVDASAFDAHDSKWQNEETNAEQALAAAHKKQRDGEDASQDIASATRRIAKAASEMQAINAYKAQFPDQFGPDGARRAIPQQRQQQPVYQQQPQARPAPEPQAAPTRELQTWIADNPWIDARNAEHDPQMARSATVFSNSLDILYQEEGRADEIGGTEYLNELDGMLQKKYPEAYGQPVAQPQTRRPTMTRPNGAGVAPASRQSPTPMNGQSGSNSVRLSSEEHDFALIQTRNGVYKYPVGHPKQGQRMSDADGVRYHAQYVQRDRDMEPMRGKR